MESARVHSTKLYIQVVQLRFVKDDYFLLNVKTYCLSSLISLIFNGNNYLFPSVINYCVCPTFAQQLDDAECNLGPAIGHVTICLCM